MKTTSRLIFERFGGIVAYRYRDGEHGAYSDQYPELWEQTRSPSEADLRAKLRAMPDDHKRAKPEMDWKIHSHQYAQTAEQMRTRVMRGAAASAKVTRLEANFDDVSDWGASITEIARQAGCSWTTAKAERERRMRMALGMGEAAE